MDAAITSQDINGPVTNKALDQLLRGPAVTIEDLQVRVVSLEERCEELENYTRCNKMRHAPIIDDQKDMKRSATGTESSTN